MSIEQAEANNIVKLQNSSEEDYETLMPREKIYLGNLEQLRQAKS
jgi:hypothetical protein